MAQTSCVTRRSFTAHLLTAALSASKSASSQSQTSGKPNLVLFLADDHGYFDSPVYGDPTVRTPTLERLAKEGTVFTHAFSGAAICIPSRAIIASGLCSWRNGATANGKQMHAGIKTLPSYLKEQGYATAHFGKSHFLPAASYQDWQAVPSEIKGEGTLNNDLDPAAVETWLANRPNKSQPICLIVCCHSPHVTWRENDGYDPAQLKLPASSIDTPETRQMRARYYSDITKMDTQLAAVYASVQKHLPQNTLFLYTSDNGAQWPFAKWNLYDAGIRLPMIAVWPGRTRAKARTSAMVSFTDILPTFIEAAGGAAPAQIDGRSFLKVLTGQTNRHRTEIYASHTADNNGQMNCYPMRAVHDGRFKYIRNLKPEFAYHTHIDRGVARDGRTLWDSWLAAAKSNPQAAVTVKRYHQRPAEELYDTQADPHELHNLAADPRHAAKRKALSAKIDQWMAGMNDPGEVFGTPRPLADVKWSA